MIRPIITEKQELAKKSRAVIDPLDFSRLIDDLIETAEHHRTENPIGCVGLAANQIGELVRIITVWNGGRWVVMINPVIELRAERRAKAVEGCLSRPGVNRKIERYKRIKVSYLGRNGSRHSSKLSNFPARVVQHEVDHLNGVFI